MSKIYVQPINGQWKDDVGGKLYAEANEVIQVVNAVAEKMEDTLKRVESHKNDDFEYTPRTPELEELKERLERELRI